MPRPRYSRFRTAPTAFGILMPWLSINYYFWEYYPPSSSYFHTSFSLAYCIFITNLSSLFHAYLHGIRLNATEVQDTRSACGGWNADASSEGFSVMYVVIYSFHQVSLKGNRFIHIHIYLCLSSYPPLYFFPFFFCLSISLLFCCSCFLREWHHFICLDVYSEKSKRNGSV